MNQGRIIVITGAPGTGKTTTASVVAYDGGKWALENMDSNYNDVIKNAMEDYLSDTNNSYDNTRLKEFAGEAISLINDCVNTNKIRK